MRLSAFSRRLTVAAGAAVALSVGGLAIVLGQPDSGISQQEAGRHLASASFENGSSGPFKSSTPIGANANIAIVADPTGQLSGKVLQLRYTRQSVRAGLDVNRAVTFTHPAGVGLGETVFVRGDVVVPTPAANTSRAMRKLIYVQRRTNDESFAVIKADGPQLRAEITGNRLFRAGPFPYGTKASIEIQITANSAVGRADGVFRMWMQGQLVTEATDVIWLTTPAPFKQFRFGQQVQHERHDKGVLFDELRYWDNLVVSATRIGT